MALNFKRGDSVVQKAFVIEGPVTDIKLVDDEPQFEVTYTGEDGETHRKFFKETEIEAAVTKA